MISVRWAAAIVGIAAVSCAGPKGRIVESVAIDSTGQVDASDAADGLANHPPKGIVFKEKAEFEPLALEIDRRRIETWFHSRGYFSAKVTDLEVDETEKGVQIRVQVDEGPLATLEAVHIAGAPTRTMVDRASLEAIARLETAEPVEYDAFIEGKKNIEARLANEGYAYAKVHAELEVEKDSGRAIAHYYVEPGPLARFGKVRVEGNSGLPDSFVTNRVSWDEGDRFDPAELDQTRARLFKSGLVADVRFDRETEEPTENVDLVIQTSGGKRHEFKLGAGLGLLPAYYEVRGRIGYTHKSFIDPLLTLRVEGRPSYAFFRSGDDSIAGFNWEASVDLAREDLFFPRLTGDLGGEYRMLQLEGYAMSGPTGRITFSRTFVDDRLIASLALDYEQRQFSRITFALTPEELASFGLIDPLNFAFLAPAIAYDARDDALTPRSGFWASLRLETGWVFSGSSFYLKLTPEVRGYLPLGSRVVLATRVRFGAGLLSDRAIPIPQRYFGGGGESHRGFGRRRLSPMAPSIEGGSIPVGGEASFESSFEARVDLFKVFGQTLSAVAFADAGDVTLSVSDLDFAKLHYAIGPGVRLLTPVGVVRLDVGFRLNRMGPTDPDPDSPYAIHLSLGEAF
jgi:translocation and assembly module TamA